MYGQGRFPHQIGQGPLRPLQPPSHQPYVGHSQPAVPPQHGQPGQFYLNTNPPPRPPLQNRPPVHSYLNTHQNIQWAPNMYNIPPQQSHHHNLLPPPPPPPPVSPPPPPPASPPPLPTSEPDNALNHDLRPPPPPSEPDNVNRDFLPPPPPSEPDNVSNHDLPPPPPKPRDAKIVRKIEVLCQYIVKNGPDFEDMTLKKELRNPEFDFLFGGEPGSEAELAHEYFLWMKTKLLSKLQEQKRDNPLSVDSDMDMEDDITQAVDKQGVENKTFESPSHGLDLKESSILTHIDSNQVSREPIPVTDSSKPEKVSSPFRLVPVYDSDEISENANEAFEDLSPAKVDTLAEEVGPDVQTNVASKSVDSLESETVRTKPDTESSQDANKSDKNEDSTGGGISKQKKAQRVDEFGRLVREGASESESDSSRQRRHKRREKRHRSRSPIRSRDQRSRSRDRRRRSPRRRKDKRSRSHSRSPRKRSRSRSPYMRGSEFGGRRDKGQQPECFDFRRGKCHRGESCRYLHCESDKTDGYKSKTPYEEIPESNSSDLYEKNAIENVTPDRNDKSLVTLVAESEKAQEVTEAFDIEDEIVEQQEQEQNSGNGTSWIQQPEPEPEPVHHNPDNQTPQPISDNQTPQTMNDFPNLPPPPPPPRNFNFYQQQPPSTFYQPPLYSAPPNTLYQPPPMAPLPAQLGVFQPNILRPYIANLPAQHQSAPQFGGPTNQFQQQNMPFLSQPAGGMQPFFGNNANSTFPIFQSHYNPYASTFSQPLNSNFSGSNAFNQEQAEPVTSLGSKEQYDPVFDSIGPPKLVQGINHEVVKKSDSVLRVSGSNNPLNLEENKHKEEENDEYGETAGAVENDSPSEPFHDDGTTTPPAGEVEIDQEVISDSQGKNKSGKDSRSMKLFKNSLANFVKEVLKPSWRQGNMSKEAFKTIVKKTVDKVSGAMKAHHVPKSKSKINHYMDSNQRKLTKLVMGYVDKYVKS